MGSIVARRRIVGDVLITRAEFITYVESATRNEYWIDYPVYEAGRICIQKSEDFFTTTQSTSAT